MSLLIALMYNYCPLQTRLSESQELQALYYLQYLYKSTGEKYTQAKPEPQIQNSK